MQQKNKSSEILFLYSHVMGYTYACLKKLKQIYNYKITLVHYPENRLSPFKMPFDPEIITLPKDRNIVLLLKNKKFDLVFVPGWMDKDYLKLAQHQRKKGAVIVAGCDTQWNGSFRQWIGLFYGRFYLKRIIDYWWVPGIFQYELIRKFGYKKDQILFNLYCADILKFEEAYCSKPTKTKNLIFVGRLVETKGVLLLVEAFNELNKELNLNWNLIIVGNGHLREKISGDRIDIINFSQPEDLITILNNAGIFVLPSIYEPWGVVVHEFSAAGFPLVLSDACGSHIQFLKHDYNGYLFKSNDKESLKMALTRMYYKSDSELALMGKRSNIISKSITLEQWAATLSFLLMK